MAFDAAALAAMGLAAGILWLWPVRLRCVPKPMWMAVHLLLCALLPLGMWRMRGSGAELYLLAVLLSGLSAIALSDVINRTVPDPIVIALGCVGIAQVALFFRPVWPVHVVSALAVGAFMLVVHLVSKGGLGMGDVKLMVLITLFLGPISAMGAFMIGSIAAAGFAVVLWIRTRDRKRAFAFAPFLALGAAVLICTG